MCWPSASSSAPARPTPSHAPPSSSKRSTSASPTASPPPPRTGAYRRARTIQRRGMRRVPRRAPPSESCASGMRSRRARCNVRATPHHRIPRTAAYTDTDTHTGHAQYKNPRHAPRCSPHRPHRTRTASSLVVPRVRSARPRSRVRVVQELEADVGRAGLRAVARLRVRSRASPHVREYCPRASTLRECGRRRRRRRARGRRGGSDPARACRATRHPPSRTRDHGVAGVRARARRMSIAVPGGERMEYGMHVHVRRAAAAPGLRGLPPHAPHLHCSTIDYAAAVVDDDAYVGRGAASTVQQQDVHIQRIHQSTTTCGTPLSTVDGFDVQSRMYPCMIDTYHHASTYTYT